MSSLIHQFDSASWLDWLSHCAMRGAAVLLIAMIVALVMRRASSAGRYLALLLGTVALLLVPVLSVVLPGWRVLPIVAVVPPVVHTPPPTLIEAIPTIIPASADLGLVPSNIPPQATVVQSPLPKLSPTAIPVPIRAEPIPWQCWILLGWCAGCGVYLTYLAAAYFSLALLGHRSRRITDPQWTQLLDEAKQRLNFNRPVRLIQSARRSMPMTWGIVHTSILLPADADDWPPSQQRAVLLHELAHARRWDCLTQLLVQLACALHWFNPLIWMNWKWMQIEREKACDDLVLSAGAKASAYAEQLLQIASQHRGGSMAAIAMARRSSMEGRLLAILDTKRNRRAITWSAAAIALVLMAGIAAPLAMLRAQEASREPAKAIRAATTQPNDEAVKRERMIAVENAQRHFDDAEKQYKAGLVTRLEYETADWDLKIAKARLSSDPVEEMVQRRLAADAMLKTTSQLYEAGLVPKSKLREAQGNAKLQRVMLDWQLDNPTWAAKWRTARVVTEATGSVMDLSQHNFTLSVQQGNSVIVADRMIIHTVAGDVCYAYVPFDYTGYNGFQLSDLNTGLTFQADLIEFNSAGELIVDHKVATTQMALGSGPPTTAPVQATASIDAIRLENARNNAKIVEQKLHLGVASPLDYKRATWDLKILEAEQTGDRIAAAKARLDAATEIGKLIEQLCQAGLVDAAELQAAQGDVNLRQAELEAEKANPADAAAMLAATQVKQASGSTIILSNHNGQIRLQQGDSVIEADRIVIRTVAGHVCVTEVLADKVQLTDMNDGRSFGGDRIEFNATGEISAKKEVVPTTQGVLGTPTTAPVRATGSLLSFRIAAREDASIDKPSANLLPDSLAKRWSAELEKNGPQPAAGFAWLPASNAELFDVDLLPPNIVAVHGGTHYMLLRDDPAQKMVSPPVGLKTWGLSQPCIVKTNPDGGASLSFTLDSTGAELFGKLTESNLHQPLAMLIDDKVMMVATIQSKIGSKVMMSFGPHSKPAEVESLAAALNAGMIQPGAATAPTTQANAQDLLNLRPRHTPPEVPADVQQIADAVEQGHHRVSSVEYDFTTRHTNADGSVTEHKGHAKQVDERGYEFANTYQTQRDASGKVAEPLQITEFVGETASGSWYHQGEPRIEYFRDLAHRSERAARGEHFGSPPHPEVYAFGNGRQLLRDALQAGSMVKTYWNTEDAGEANTRKLVFHQLVGGISTEQDDTSETLWIDTAHGNTVRRYESRFPGGVLGHERDVQVSDVSGAGDFYPSLIVDRSYTG